MINTLWRFEQNVSGLHSLILLAGAIITIAAGVFVCLRGVGFRRVMLAVTGFYCGIAAGIFMAGLNLMMILAFAGAGLLLALWLQESFLILIASIFGTVYGFSVLIGPYFTPSDDIMSMLRELTIGVPYYNWPILLCIMFVPVAISSVNWQAGSSVLGAAMSTAMFLAGVIMLLKSDGLSAVGFITRNKQMSLGLFIFTVVVIGCVQYFVLPRISSRFEAAKEMARVKAKRARRRRKSDEGKSDSKGTAWRTA